MWESLKSLSTSCKELESIKEYHYNDLWVKFTDEKGYIIVSSNSSDPLLNAKYKRDQMTVVATLIIPVALEFFDKCPRLGV